MIDFDYVLQNDPISALWLLSALNVYELLCASNE